MSSPSPAPPSAPIFKLLPCSCGWGALHCGTVNRRGHAPVAPLLVAKNWGNHGGIAPTDWVLKGTLRLWFDAA